jgi:hypothetical protein
LEDFARRLKHTLSGAELRRDPSHLSPLNGGEGHGSATGRKRACRTSNETVPQLPFTALAAIN